MEGSFSDRYVFIGEWYDGQASLIRRFNIFYYPTDGTIEMNDLKFRKTFLHRVKVDGVHLESFFLGSTIPILGRLVKIVDFACEDTRKRLSKDLEVTFCLIKPIPTKTAGNILSHLHKHGTRVTKMKMVKMTTDDVQIIFEDMAKDPTFPFLLDYLSGHEVYGMEVVGSNAVDLCKKIIGDGDPLKAEPGTIRAIYGTDPVRNCIHSSSTPEIALKDIKYFFPPAALRSPRLPLTATLSNCTLCVVKPHAVRAGALGAALVALDEGGFRVTALNMLIVEAVNAAEFYEVYKGIVPEYQGMVEELSSGQCVAMEIVAKDRSVNSAVEFRKLVGPSDPEIARLLRPHTLRAKFGKNKVLNAIHCSDLAEDGLLEVEYFFKILDV